MRAGRLLSPVADIHRDESPRAEADECHRNPDRFRKAGLQIRYDKRESRQCCGEEAHDLALFRSGSGRQVRTACRRGEGPALSLSRSPRGVCSGPGLALRAAWIGSHRRQRRSSRAACSNEGRTRSERVHRTRDRVEYMHSPSHATRMTNCGASRISRATRSRAAISPSSSTARCPCSSSISSGDGSLPPRLHVLRMASPAAHDTFLPSSGARSGSVTKAGVLSSGRGRCTERAFLEFHHVEPYVAGGGATVDNIQLRIMPGAQGLRGGALLRLAVVRARRARGGVLVTGSRHVNPRRNRSPAGASGPRECLRPEVNLRARVADVVHGCAQGDSGPGVFCCGRIPFSFPPNAGVAQLVEQLIRNQQVLGSSPSAGSRFP